MNAVRAARSTSEPDRLDRADRVDLLFAELEAQAAEETRRKRFLTHAVLAAIALHLAIALLVPRHDPAPTFEAAVRKVIRLAPTPRFVKIPPPPAASQPPTRKVPVPDPTPEEIEPLRTLAPPAAVPLILDTELGAIPAPPPAEPVETIRYVSGDILAPPKLYAPDPQYPEVARRIRKEGTVVLKLQIGVDGAIEAIEPLTTLGFGLEEAAVAAVSRWQFGPATLNGEPLPVIYNLTVRFSIGN